MKEQRILANMDPAWAKQTVERLLKEDDSNLAIRLMSVARPTQALSEAWDPLILYLIEQGDTQKASDMFSLAQSQCTVNATTYRRFLNFFAKSDGDVARE
jgi:hypothetical protein